MNAVKSYKKLDLSKLNFSDKPMDADQALKDAAPMYIPKKVLDGLIKVVADTEGIHYVQNV